MTAVEQLVSNIRALAHDKRHHLGMGDIRITQGLLDELEEQAKEMEKEEKQLEYTRGFDDGYQRKNQEFDYLRGKNHSCQDNFKNSFKHELNKSE